MRRSLHAALPLLVMATGLPTAAASDDDPFLPVAEYVLVDDEADVVTFSLVFEDDPTAALHTTDGLRQELAWQYWIYIDEIDDGIHNSDRIVTARWIQDEDAILVQETQGDGPLPDGWGPIRGWVDYAIIERGDHFVMTATVGDELMGDDGHFAYDMIATVYGAAGFTSSGVSGASPPFEARFDAIEQSIPELSIDENDKDSLIRPLSRAEEHHQLGRGSPAIRSLDQLARKLEAARDVSGASDDPDADLLDDLINTTKALIAMIAVTT